MRCDGHSHWKTAGEDNKKVHSKGKGRVKGSLGHSAVQGAGQSGAWSSPQAGGQGEGVGYSRTRCRSDYRQKMLYHPCKQT